MTEVEFITSNQGHQAARIAQLVERLRQRRPDIFVRVTDAGTNPGVLQRYKLQFGPGIAINGRIEFVGIPRFKMLFERLLQVHEARPNPRTAAPPEAPKPAAAPRPAPRPTPAAEAPPPG